MLTAPEEPRVSDQHANSMPRMSMSTLSPRVRADWAIGMMMVDPQGENPHVVVTNLLLRQVAEQSDGLDT